MAQGILPYKYEEEKNASGMTALAGLPVYLDLASVLGLGDHIRAHLQVKNPGMDRRADVLPCISSTLPEEISVDDLRFSKRMKGFCKVLGRVETKGLTRQSTQSTVKDGGERILVVRSLLLPPYSGILKPSMILTRRRNARRVEPSSLPEPTPFGTHEGKPRFRRIRPDTPSHD